MRIGIDVGKVLVEYGRGKTDGPLINVEGALEVLQEWKDKGYHLFIISFCKESHAITRTNRFISDGHSHLFEYEYYVEERFYKGDVIKTLQLDCMIDDNQALLYDIKMKNPGIHTILYQEFNKQKHHRDKHNLLAGGWDDVQKMVNEIATQKESQKLDKNQDFVEFSDKDLFDKKIQPQVINPSSLSDTYEVNKLHDKAIFIS